MDQDRFVATIPALPCPVCAASPTRRRWSTFTNEQYTRIRSEKRNQIGSTVVPLVCSQCGFVQLFVDPADFRN